MVKITSLLDYSICVDVETKEGSLTKVLNPKGFIFSLRETESVKNLKRRRLVSVKQVTDSETVIVTPKKSSAGKIDAVAEKKGTSEASTTKKAGKTQKITLNLDEEGGKN